MLLAIKKEIRVTLKPWRLSSSLRVSLLDISLYILFYELIPLLEVFAKSLPFPFSLFPLLLGKEEVAPISPYCRGCSQGGAVSRNQKEEEEEEVEGRCQIMISKTFSLRLRDNMQNHS